jgi:hypothetical protein
MFEKTGRGGTSSPRSWNKVLPCSRLSTEVSLSPALTASLLSRVRVGVEVPQASSTTDHLKYIKLHFSNSTHKCFLGRRVLSGW